MAKALGSRLRVDRAKTLFDLEDQIILRLRGTNRMLLVDEAHQLQLDALELLRDNP